MVSPAPSSSPGLTRADILTRAQKLVPNIAERALRCASERRVPAETIREWKASSLLRVSQPRRYGGSELGRDIMCEVVELFAAACGSQGWVYFVLADHDWMLGTFSAQAQDDVWGGDPDAVISSAFAPPGKAKPVSDGYEFSGRLTFSSGIDHADWVICHAYVQGTTEGLWCLVPKRDGKVIDDWHVTGLEGTGSKSFEVSDAFVPAYRTMAFQDSMAGTGPGTTTNTSPHFRLTRNGYTSAALSAAMVGMAEGLKNTWLASMAKRKVFGVPAAASEHLQIVAAKAAMEIDAARLLYLTTIREATDRLQRGESLYTDQIHQDRARFAFAVQLALSAAARMRDVSGASTIQHGNTIDRQYRNIVAGSQHVGINWPRSAASLGSMLMIANGADLPRPSL